MGASSVLTYLAIGLTVLYLGFFLNNMYVLFHPPSFVETPNAKAKPNPFVYPPLWRWANESEKVISIRMYLTTSSSDYKTLMNDEVSDSTPQLWKASGLQLSEATSVSLNVSLPKSIVMKKGLTLHAHIFISKGINQSENILDPYNTFYTTVTLTKELTVLDPNATQSLLDSPSKNPSRRYVPEIMPHWISIIKLQFVDDQTFYTAEALPADIYNSGAFRLVYNTKSSRKEYYPIVFHNDLVVLRQDYIPLIPESAAINDETKFPNLVKITKGGKMKSDETLVVPLRIEFSSISLGWWRLSLHLREALHALAGFGFSETEVPTPFLTYSFLASSFILFSAIFFCWFVLFMCCFLYFMFFCMLCIFSHYFTSSSPPRIIIDRQSSPNAHPDRSFSPPSDCHSLSPSPPLRLSCLQERHRLLLIPFLLRWTLIRLYSPQHPLPVCCDVVSY